MRRVQLADGPVFEAVDIVGYWNGWVMPVFDLDNALAIGLHVIEHGWGVAAYDPETHEFHFALMDAPGPLAGSTERPIYQPGFFIEWTEEGPDGRVLQLDARLETYDEQLKLPAEPAGLWMIGEGWCWEEVDE